MSICYSRVPVWPTESLRPTKLASLRYLVSPLYACVLRDLVTPPASLVWRVLHLATVAKFETYSFLVVHARTSWVCFQKWSHPSVCPLRASLPFPFCIISLATLWDLESSRSIFLVTSHLHWWWMRCCSVLCFYSNLLNFDFIDSICILLWFFWGRYLFWDSQTIR